MLGRSHSMSSIASMSSEVANINFNDSLLFEKEKSIKFCINEFNLINKKLEEKILNLKKLEDELQCRENNIVSLCNSVNKYIQSEVSKKSRDAINEYRVKYSELDSKYNSLNKQHNRLQCSFKAIKEQNKTLKLQLKEHHFNEDHSRKERDKLVSKLNVLSSNNGQHFSVKQSSVSVQTSDRTKCKDVSSLSSCNDPGKAALDSTLSFVLREVWLQMFHISMEGLLIGDKDGTMPFPRQSFVDISLLVIPMSVEYLRSNIVTNTDAFISQNLRKRYSDMITYHIEMLYWSMLYTDIARIPMRPGMMSPLTRLGEDLAAIIMSKTSLIKDHLTSDKDTHALLVLLALRCVNQVDVLGSLLHHLAEMVTDSSMASILLSKYMLVPLLCRWTSTAACYSCLYPRMLSIVLQSLDYKLVRDKERCSVIAIRCHDHNQVVNTGLEQLIFLIARLPVNGPDTRKASCSHPLVFLLDILHTTKTNDNDKIIAVFRKIIHLKQIRLLCREVGMIGIVSNLISQCTQSSTSLPSLVTLRSILAQLTSN